MNFFSDFDVNKVSGLVNKVKNAVMNYTEYQAKVMDATNNEPWGASSTLMQEIASATHNPQHFFDIMETIYKKFNERGSNWRQCYKALQLLEYLIKNGSERVVDNAKDHMYDLKALKNFHHVDDKGKDQGINVRNRSNEILELLGDDNKIREERKKAKENKAKYTGVSSDAARSGFGSSSGGFGGTGSKYGGFGSDSYFQSGSNSQYNGFKDSSSSGKYDDSPAKEETKSPTKIQVVLKNESGATSQKKNEPNLLDFKEEDDWGDFTAATNDSKPSQAGFTGFQSATPATSQAGFAAFQSAAPTNSQSGFTSFQSATPATQPSQNGFAAFQSATPATSQAGFTNFQSATPATSQNGFAAFQSATPAIPPTQIKPVQTFAAFPAVQPTANPSSTLGFASFGQVQTSAQQPVAAVGGDVFGLNTSFQKPSSPVKKDDPFGNLVSLDPLSLTHSGKKPEQTGPSLNAISKEQTAIAFGFQPNSKPLNNGLTSQPVLKPSSNDITLI